MDFNFDIKVDEGEGEKGVISGYGSTFGGKPDAYGDVIVEGAFSESIQKGGHTGLGVAMLWQHDPHNPIGVWTELVEVKKGLKVRGEYALGVQQADEAYILSQKGALKGLSIGFNASKWEHDKDKGIRYITKADLWEISPVTFPANVRAKITNVKQLIDGCETVRDFEHYLRDAGLSIKDSKYIVSLCKEKLFEKKRDDSKELDEILSQLKNINKEIKIL